MRHSLTLYTSSSFPHPLIGTVPCVGPVLDAYHHEKGIGIAPGHWDEDIASIFATILSNSRADAHALRQAYHLNLKENRVLQNNTRNLDLFLKQWVLPCTTTQLVVSTLENTLYWDNLYSCPLSAAHMNSQSIKDLVLLFKDSKEMHAYPVRRTNDLQSLPILFFSPQVPTGDARQLKRCGVVLVPK